MYSHIFVCVYFKPLYTYPVTNATEPQYSRPSQNKSQEDTKGQSRRYRHVSIYF